MITTLAELLAPLSTFEFLQAFRRSRRLHIQASDAARMASLLSWQDIESLVPRLALEDKLCLMRDGVTVPRQFYKLGERNRFNARAFNDLAAQGVSVVVDSIDYSIPQIGRLAVAIERELGIRTNINGYLSFSKGGAFKPHWDPADVLVLQVHGKKQWRIWNAQVVHPTERADTLKVDASLPPDQVIELMPGDVLFIPRGEPHSAAVSSTDHSVHLSIGLNSLTGLDFVDNLREEAAKDLLLRMNLPRHSSAEEALMHEASLKRQLHQLIDAASVTKFLQENDLRRRPVLQTALSVTLPQTDSVLCLTLRRRIPLPDVVSGDPQPVTIGGEEFRLAPASIDIIRWLFDNDPATRCALEVALSSRYRQSSIEAAMRELLHYGFLAVNHAN